MIGNLTSLWWWHKNARNFLLLILLMAVVFGGAVQCRTSPSSVEQLHTILESSPNCKRPCWQGLVPGVSTKSDFLTVVNSSPQSRFDNLRENPLFPSGIQYIWHDHTTSLTSYLEVHDYNETISFVSFRFEQDVSVKSVSQLLDSPDSYIAQVFIGEAFLFDLYLFYEEEGVVINLRDVPFNPPESAFSPTCEVNITSDEPIRKIYLVEPGSAEEIIKSLFYEIAIPDAPQAWVGLGQVKLTSCPDKE